MTTDGRQHAKQHTRVLVHYRTSDDDPQAVERTYHEISKRMAGTAGLLRNELLTNALDAGSVVVMSEWESLEAFNAWREGPDHGVTEPLRTYQDRERGPKVFEVYQVAAAY